MIHPTDQNLTITIAREGGETIMALAGELDLHTMAPFGEQVAALAEESDLRLVLDLSGLHFVDSTGLGALIGTMARVERSGGEMTLRSPAPAVRRTIEVMKLERALPIRD